MTERLIHRIFLPDKPYNEEWATVLPRMSRSDSINQQLYALIGLILRQFVQSWYTKISDDGQFIIEVTSVISKISRSLEQRVLKLDIDDIILDKLPFIIDSHMEDYRLVKQRRINGLIGDRNESISTSFHRLHPHKALDSMENEQLFLKLLSKGLMVVTLDDDSVQSSPARALVSSILNDIVLKNAVEKLSEPWMIDDIIIKLLGPIVEKKNMVKEKDKGKTENNADIISNEPKISSMSSNPLDANYRLPITSQFASLYDQIVKSSASIIASGGRLLAFVISLSSNHQQKKEGTSNKDDFVRNNSDTSLPVAPLDITHSTTAATLPISLVNRKIFTLLSHISHLDQRNPLLISTLSAIAIPFTRSRHLIELSSRISSYYIDKYIRNESMVTTILRSARENLFPQNGFMGPPRIIPTEQEQIEMHKIAINTIIEVAPERMRYLTLGTNPYNEVDDILDSFSDRTINKHLIYNLLDFLITSLIPELIEETPHQILQERLKQNDNL